MRRLRDNGWQFITTMIISFVSLIFSILFFQGDNSLRLVGVVVIIILIVVIVLINVLPKSKSAGQPPNANVVPTPTENMLPTYNQQGNIAPLPVRSLPGQSQYPYPVYPQTPIYAPPPPGIAIPTRRPPRITPSRLWLLTFALIGFITQAYIITVGMYRGSSTAIPSPIEAVLVMIALIALTFGLGTWIFALVDTARLGYWGGLCWRSSYMASSVRSFISFSSQLFLAKLYLNAITNHIISSMEEIRVGQDFLKGGTHPLARNYTRSPVHTNPRSVI